jgi:hypothetical protein
VTAPANHNLEVVERGVMMLLLAERRHWAFDELRAWINEERFEQALDGLEEVGLLGLPLWWHGRKPYRSGVGSVSQYIGYHRLRQPSTVQFAMTSSDQSSS